MLTTRSTRHHPEFDLRRAAQAYEKVKPQPNPQGEMITSPYDVYSVETLRDRLKLRSGKAIPTATWTHGLRSVAQIRFAREKR